MELVRAWTSPDGGVKQAIIKVRQALTSSNQDDLTELLNALLWGVARGVVPQEEILTALADAGLADNEHATEALADVLWVISNQAERMRDQGDATTWTNMCSLIGAIHSRALVPSVTLKSVLELEILHEAGISSEPPATVTKKIVRINTRNLYTQNKFNLLKEESEGFAKVLSLMHSEITCENLQSTKTHLLSLIGYFDLDPNRVLDLVLDAYEVHYTNDCFMELLTEFKVDGLAHVLGFKFHYYTHQSKPAPRSLYRLAATMIRNGLLSLAAMFSHLSPTKEAIVASAQQDRATLVERAKSYGKVNLNAKKDDDGDGGATVQATVESKHASNQVYGLIIGLLEIGATDQGFALIEWFTSRQVNPLEYKPLALQVCQFIHDLVDEVYAPLSLKALQFATKQHRGAEKDRRRVVAPVQSVDEFVVAVLPKLHLVGGHLHYDQFLWTKLLRILNGSTAIPPDAVESLIHTCFIPAMSMHHCCPHLVYQTWDLLKAYSVQKRYGFYLHWQSLYSSTPDLMLKHAQTIQHTRKIMRRLTADKTKPTGRLLTHVAHANPLVAFRTILQQLQSYENLIQPVVECLKYMSPLGMDVLSYVLISELSRPRKTFKADGHNVSLWLSSLAQFAGSFYRKYPTVELGALLSFLFRRLSSWESGELIVLSELLTKMGSCLALEDISTTQLEALAGGPNLGFEAPDPKVNNKRAIPCLRNTLVKQNLAWPLSLVISQMRSQIEFDSDTGAKHLKLLGSGYDMAQRTLNQLLAFLHAAADPSTYIASLPSVAQLIHEFHVPHELAMVLVRPAMRAHDPLLRKVRRSVHAGGSGSSSSEEAGPWYMYSATLLDDVEKAFGAAAGDGHPFGGMTKQLFTTFWGLTLYDIYVPHGQYNAEIEKAKNDLKQLAAGNATGEGGKKKPKERLMSVIDNLVNEMKDQVAHRKAVFGRIEEHKDEFFLPTQDTTVVQLLQRCVLPRSLLSPEDAVYCAKFMHHLHSIGVPNLSTLQYYQKVTLNLSGLVLCTTEREASNFGIFMRETFSLLSRWYQHADDYKAEGTRTGFSLSLTDPTNVLDYAKYKNLYAKWQSHLDKVYTHTLATGDYMPTRNSLVLLTKMIDVFPTTKTTSDKLFALVETLMQDDRKDLKLMATSYSALLKRRINTLFADMKATTSERSPSTQTATTTTTSSSSKRGRSRDRRDARDKKDDASERATRGRSRDKKPDSLPPLAPADKSTGGASGGRARDGKRPAESPSTPTDNRKTSSDKDRKESSTTSEKDKKQSSTDKERKPSTTEKPSRGRSREKPKQSESSKPPTPTEKAQSRLPRDKKLTPQTEASQLTLSSADRAPRGRSRDKKQPAADDSSQQSAAADKPADRPRDTAADKAAEKPTDDATDIAPGGRSRDMPNSQGESKDSNKRTIPALATEASLKRQIVEREQKKREREVADAADQPSAKSRKLTSSSLADVNAKRVQDEKKRRLEQRKSSEAATDASSDAKLSTSRSGGESRTVEPPRSSNHRQDRHDHSYRSDRANRDRRDGGSGRDNSRRY
ncbi:hypothetical protein H310_10146 [Aphanomyces invadans]|uniref:THO complex subunit 2 n=2 Tax=Aphanomyces invadans TaxID=157072 RepID=A0A024TRV3_9STRA|nr:hypothetical protein H310_10146 [Aphanomyces invadans]ETV96865.1 hypothetical protein H310_10146 [Aphanomyces invadans]|eukprot:XP_008874643.1 hypothetical protein H310_10146 [Aphanomyces invadans]